MAIDPARNAQIALLIIKKVQILVKYLDFSNIFFKENALILSKATDLNQYIINLQKCQQLSYKFIYSLSLMKLKMLKIYIKINFFNGFI